MNSQHWQGKPRCQVLSRDLVGRGVHEAVEVHSHQVKSQHSTVPIPTETCYNSHHTRWLRKTGSKWGIGGMQCIVLIGDDLTTSPLLHFCWTLACCNLICFETWSAEVSTRLLKFTATNVSRSMAPLLSPQKAAIAATTQSG